MKKIPIVLLFVLAPIISFAQTFPSIYAVKGIADLAPATLVAFASGFHVSISSALTASENATFPSDIFIHFAPGGSISVASGKRITISGTVIAYPKPIFLGSGTVRFSNCKNTEVCAEWWGAGQPGSTNDSPYIQACIDSVKGSIGNSTYWSPVIKFQRWEYPIGSIIDMGGSNGIHLSGVTSINNTGTVFKGSTGAGCPVIDATAAHSGTIEDIYFNLTGAATSTVGILVGYAGTDSIGFRFRRVGIYAVDDNSANGNLGTVGIFNVCSEHSSYEDCNIYANIPLILSTSGATSWIHGDTTSTYVATSSFRTLNGPSCGIHNFMGNNILVARDATRPVVAMWNANTVSFGTTYFGRESATGSYTPAIHSYSSVNVSAIGSHFENIKTMMDAENIYGLDVDAYLTDVSSNPGSYPIITWPSSGKMTSADVKVYCEQAAKPWFPTFASDHSRYNCSFTAANPSHLLDPVGSGTYNSNFADCTFKTLTKTTVLDQFGRQSVTGVSDYGQSGTGAFANKTLFNIISLPATYSVGASTLDVSLSVFANTVNYSCSQVVVASATIAQDASGTIHPIYLTSIATTQPSSPTVASFCDLSGTYVYLASDTTGWKVLFGTNVTGFHNTIATLTVQWDARLRNNGYGSQKPSICIP